MTLYDFDPEAVTSDRMIDAIMAATSTFFTPTAR
jgi:hypothetical protein